jgi:hypothetical protein
MRARQVGLAVSLSLALAGARARAQDGSNAATGQALYDRATQEMDRKDYASACPRLEEVVKLVPDGVGARLTLGQCYEGLGKLASAWSAYAGAEATAQRLGQADRAAQARETARQLRPKLATITVVVPDAVKELQSLSVQRDGKDVGRGTWGVAIPVDRGPHTIVASATGKAAWSRTIDVAADGGVVVVTIDPLADATQPVSTSPPLVAEPPRRGVPALAVAGFAVAGAGVALGAVTGALTLAKGCRSDTCTASGLSSAKTTAWISDIGFGIGVAGAVVGVVGLATAGPKPAQAAYYVRVAPDRFAFGGTF